MRQSSVRGDREHAGDASRTHRSRGWDDGPYQDAGGCRRTRPGWTPADGRCRVVRCGDGAGRRGRAPQRRPAARRQAPQVLRWSASALSRPDTRHRRRRLPATTSTSTATSARTELNLGDSELDEAGPQRRRADPAEHPAARLGRPGHPRRTSKLGGATAGPRTASRWPTCRCCCTSPPTAATCRWSRIPRDTRVTIPKCTDPDDRQGLPADRRDRSNQSLQHGGPGCTVATWEELTGIYIDHFMMIDFAGVVSMADAIGGVPVCVNNNVYSHDSKGHGSGLKLKKGTHSVKGEQALQWLRTRYGFEDGTDIGRAKAQHMYMNSMVRQLQGGHQAHRPGQAARPGRGGHQGADRRRGPRHRQEALRPGQRAQAGADQAHHHGDHALAVQPRTSRTSCPSRATRSRSSRCCATTSRWTARTRRRRPTPDPEPTDRAQGADRRSWCRTAPAARRTAAGHRPRPRVVRQLLVRQGLHPGRRRPRAHRPRPTPPITLPERGRSAGDALAVAKALGLPESAVQEVQSASRA